MSKNPRDTNLQFLSNRDLFYKLKGGFDKDKKFPVKIMPLEDEVLSSWFYRLAIYNHSHPSTFFNLFFPHIKNYFWSGDVDINVKHDLLAELAYKAHLPYEVLYNATLRAYEGVVYSDYNCGRNNFITLIKRRGRHNLSHGQRICPRCLQEDKIAYFRKSWRISVNCICVKHGAWVLDSCDECGSPLMLYVQNHRDAHLRCYCCKKPLASMETLTCSKKEQFVQLKINDIVNKGFFEFEEKREHSLAFFEGFSLFIKIILAKQKYKGLYGTEAYEQFYFKYGRKSDFKDKIDIKTMLSLLTDVIGVFESDETLSRFISDNKIGKTEIAFTSSLPYWLSQAVYHKIESPRVVSLTEIRHIIKYLMKKEGKVNLELVNKTIGTKMDYRKNKMITQFIRVMTSM